MPRSILSILLLAVFVSAAAPNSFAWDDVGHKISAYIAWRQMTPAARENVIRILRLAPEDSDIATYYFQYGPEAQTVRDREYFELIATWADIVRNFGMSPDQRRVFEDRFRKYHKGNWHYSDTFWKEVNGKPELEPASEESGLAVEKLADFDKVMRSKDATDKEKAVAIAWFEHLAGDIHQPLHASARITDLDPKGDQGGNLFLLTPKGTPRADELNLHWFWDSIVNRNIPLKGETCDRAYVESLGDMMMKKYPIARMRNRLELGQYEKWKEESFALVPTNVFSPDLKRFEAPSARYKRNALRVAEQQLALAGYRMGETLNNIFGAGIPSSAAGNR